MTTILFIFIVSLALSLVLTPLAGRAGIHFGAIDRPSHRKVHKVPIPRVGGVGIFLSFFSALFITHATQTQVAELIGLNKNIIFIVSGAVVCFGVGVFDDFRRLPPLVKLAFQILAASLAFWGGLNFSGVMLFGNFMKFGVFGYLITVFWFVLFVNAVNLVDGLDGLAGGIVVFASLVMIILSVLRGDFLTAVFFAALGGSVLGFLRYNFNPASIFLGDGGSYFLGYAIAGLSIMGSVKSQVGAVMLIPLLALGVPIFDTILSPLRRFVRGRKMFSPDKGHIHHRLLGLGLNARRAVMLIYFITMGLCLIAVALVNVRDERAGLFLIVLGAGAVIFVRKLGYFEYFATDKIYGWFRDLSDEAGLSRDRRTFLSLQIDISKSPDLDEMWRGVLKAFELLEFDMAEMALSGRDNPLPAGFGGPLTWAREGFNADEGLCEACTMKLEMPLLSREGKLFGTLWMVKDLKRNPISHYTLRRVEHLRRTVTAALERFEKSGQTAVRKAGPPVADPIKKIIQTP